MKALVTSPGRSTLYLYQSWVLGKESVSSMNLYFLIYSSVPLRKLTDDELALLLAGAKNHNQSVNITGVLLCLPDMYLQLLEGPKAQVETLYKKIVQDKRHKRVTIVQEGIIPFRFFPHWHMAFETDKKVFLDKGVIDICSPQSIRLLEILQGQPLQAYKA